MKEELFVLHDNVVLRPIESAKDKAYSAAGLVRPETAEKTSRVGEVVVACNGQWHGDQFEKSNLVPHDKVVYRNYGYEIVEVNGETLLVIPLSNIVAKFVEKE